MKRLILASLIALGCTATAAYANPRSVGQPSAKHESRDVTRAREELASAKAKLKSALMAQRAASKIERAKAKLAKDQANLAKLMSLAGHDPGLELGCGTCTDNHDGSCTCPTE